MTSQDFFVTLLFQAQRDGFKPVTMRKTCLESEAGETARNAIEHGIAAEILSRGGTITIQINKIEGEPGHA